MTHLALWAVVALAQAGEGVSLEAPAGWERREDPQRRWTGYVPPNVPAGHQCLVAVLPPQEFKGTAQAWHDRLVKESTQGNQVVGDIQTGVIGVFQASAITQRFPQGQIQYVGVHTVRWGTRGQAVLFAATDLQLFQTHAPAVVAMLQKVALPGPGGYHGLVIPFPAGWTRQDEGGWVQVLPPQALSWGNPRVFVLAPRRIETTHWAAHRESLKGLVAAAKWPEGAATVRVSALTPGPFIGSEAERNDGPPELRLIRLFTAVSGDVMQSIAVTPAGGDAFLNALLGILEKTTLKDPAAAPKRPAVVEAYRRVAQKKYIRADGTFYFGRLMYERMFFLSNGVVATGSCYDAGLAGDAFVAKGDADTLGGGLARWKADGNTIRLLREPGGNETVYEKVNGQLRFGGETWTAIPRVDGMRLKGRYAWKSAPEEKTLQFNYWVEFTEDGVFRTGGVLPWLALTDMTGRPKPPETAAGTYEIRDWTLFFKMDGAVVWSTDFMTLKDDPKDLATVLIHTYGFVRE